MKKVSTELEGMVQAWLTPKGEFVVGYTGFDPSGAWHDGIASLFLKDHWNLEYEAYVYDKIDDKHSYPYEYLESEMGWLRLFSFYGNTTPRFVIPLGVSPTDAQAQAMMDWVEANGAILSISIDDQNETFKQMST